MKLSDSQTLKATTGIRAQFTWDASPRTSSTASTPSKTWATTRTSPSMTSDSKTAPSRPRTPTPRVLQANPAAPTLPAFRRAGGAIWSTTVGITVTSRVVNSTGEMSWFLHIMIFPTYSFQSSYWLLIFAYSLSINSISVFLLSF